MSRRSSLELSNQFIGLGVNEKNEKDKQRKLDFFMDYCDRFFPDEPISCNSLICFLSHLSLEYKTKEGKRLAYATIESWVKVIKAEHLFSVSAKDESRLRRGMNIVAGLTELPKDTILPLDAISKFLQLLKKDVPAMKWSLNTLQQRTLILVALFAGNRVLCIHRIDLLKSEVPSIESGRPICLEVGNEYLVIGKRLTKEMKLRSKKMVVKIWIDMIASTTTIQADWNSTHNVDPWVVLHCYLLKTKELRNSESRRRVLNLRKA